MNDLLDHHSTLFQSGLDTLKDYKAKIYVDSQAKPKFCKAQQVPYSMKSKVEEELDRLEKEGIIEPVQYVEWAVGLERRLNLTFEPSLIKCTEGSKLRCYNYLVNLKRQFRMTQSLERKNGRVHITTMHSQMLSKG